MVNLDHLTPYLGNVNFGSYSCKNPTGHAFDNPLKERQANTLEKSLDASVLKPPQQCKCVRVPL